MIVPIAHDRVPFCAAELASDVEEFGADHDRWLIYKPIGHFFCFTDYQPIVPEMPLRKEELQPDKRLHDHLWRNPRVTQQDSIFQGEHCLRGEPAAICHFHERIINLAKGKSQVRRA